MTEEIILHVRERVQRDGLFDGWIAGLPVVQNTRTPFLDACRKLIEIGSIVVSDPSRTKRGIFVAQDGKQHGALTFAERFDDLLDSRKRELHRIC